MLFEIVIPVYNAENYIGKCLQSIASQVLEDFTYNITIIDDGSTDKTKNEIQNALGRIKECLKKIGLLK